MSGKYFAATKEGAINHAQNYIDNYGGEWTITEINIPRSVLETGFMFDDIGNAGKAYHFGEEAQFQMYNSDWWNPPTILQKY